MKEYHNRHVQETPVFKPNEKVWLDMHKLWIMGIPCKPADKFAGPYQWFAKSANLPMS